MIAALAIILGGGLFYLGKGLLTVKDAELGICKNKVFTRPELEAFVQSCDEKTLLNVCGNNIGMVNPSDGETRILYFYRYPRQKLSARFRQKYGNGFAVTFVNGQPVDWDVTGLPGTIAAMTKEELGAKLKAGMTAEEIKALWGEPNEISREKERVYYTYMYQINPRQEGNVPLSLSITFEQGKAVFWGNTNGSAKFEAQLRKSRD